MQNLENRVQRLEASNRLYKKTFYFLLSAVIITVLFAFREKSMLDKLQAKQLEILDDYGNVLVRIGHSQGMGTIKTFNTSKNTLLNLGYTVKNEGYIGIGNGKDGENIRLTSSKDDGGGYISIYNNSGTPVAALFNGYYGGTLEVMDRYGYLRGMLKNHSSGGGYFSLLNGSGKKIFNMQATTGGAADFSIHDSDERERMRISVSTGGSGYMELKNSYGNKIMELGGTSAQHGVLNVYNSGSTFTQGLGGY